MPMVEFFFILFKPNFVKGILPEYWDVFYSDLMDLHRGITYVLQTSEKNIKFEQQSRWWKTLKH